MKQSKLEAAFTTQYLQVGRHTLMPEYVFDEPEEGRKKRMWRFDFANPEAKVGVELDGGEHSDGRHVRASGFIDDCEKMNAATMQGWAVLRFPGSVYTNDPAGAIEMVDDLITKRLPNVNAKEGADASTTEPEHEARTEPITVAVSEPSITGADVAAVVEAEPVETPETVELKVLPKPDKPPVFKVNSQVIVSGYGNAIPRKVTRVEQLGKTWVYGVDINGGCSWLCKEDKLTLYVEKVELKEASGQ